MRRVELFEIIRKDHREGVSRRELSRRYRVHRRTVRQALASAIPPERKPPERPRPVLLNEVCVFIDDILRADKEAPRKQRHTGHRIWQRVTGELEIRVGESTVRRYVANRKRELGVGVQAFVPQHHAPGSESQADLYDAEVVIAGEQVTAKIVANRLSSSGAAFHRAYPRASQAAFFDALAASFAFFGGVPKRIRFDNLRSAVKQILRGGRRIEQDRFIAFRSHYGFDSSFTTAGIQGAHEKGGIEGEVGRFRRRHLVPMPEFCSWDSFNDYLAECSCADLDRRIFGREQSVADDLTSEQQRLAELPEESFDVGEVHQSRVDAKCRVTVRTNRYSVPARLVGRIVQVRLTPLTVEVSHEGRVVARHPRLHLKYGETLDIDHYLDVLVDRPGAFDGSEPLHQARESGRFTHDHEEFFAHLCLRSGERKGSASMVETMLLYRRYPRRLVDEAIAAAINLGAFDDRAVAVLCRHLADGQLKEPAVLDVGDLNRYARALPTLADYDVLLDNVEVIDVEPY